MPYRPSESYQQDNNNKSLINTGIEKYMTQHSNIRQKLTNLTYTGNFKMNNNINNNNMNKVYVNNIYKPTKSRKRLFCNDLMKNIMTEIDYLYKKQVQRKNYYLEKSNGDKNNLKKNFLSNNNYLNNNNNSGIEKDLKNPHQNLSKMIPNPNSNHKISSNPFFILYIHFLY